MESNLNHIFELQYALDTFYFLICGALVMWMAAGFAMLEAGLVRAKNTTEILTKNVALFAVACTMYLIVGYDIMYDGGIFLSGVTTVAEMDDAAIAGVIAASTEAGFSDMGEYSGASDFFFQVVFVATAMSIVSGAVAERMKLWAFLAFAVVMCGFIYPMQGSWTWNGDAVFGMYELSYSDYAGSGIVHMAGAAAALAGVILLGARKGKYGAKGEIRAFPGCQPAPGNAWYLYPVDGLVRVQRWLYPEAGWHRCCQRSCQRVPEHQRCRSRWPDCCPDRSSPDVRQG